MITVSRIAERDISRTNLLNVRDSPFLDSLPSVFPAPLINKVLRQLIEQQVRT